MTRSWEGRERWHVLVRSAGGRWVRWPDARSPLAALVEATSILRERWALRPDQRHVVRLVSEDGSFVVTMATEPKKKEEAIDARG